ncbi:uncharacterized protein B0P05DRAFT_553963 [Gilbertella persicaria]|uniref:uncharacterized protein n=1 Tax=Gilbertella persicaria TaxID=101096 RepID=UPI00221E4F7C|nr:uncharacterized protein B0P05DRAFT_553963 [Gilbertella persicaria]KAI8065347.1 hypothetical protein B0P05DRAFT_553963 [Gilbertella persicaria]
MLPTIYSVSSDNNIDLESLSDSGSFSSSSTSSTTLVIPKKTNNNDKKKRYQCKECHKSFSRPSQLQTHTYTHTSEKPFQCLSPNCGRRFSVVSNLRRHLKVHQKPLVPNTLSPEDRIRCVQRLMKQCSNTSSKKKEQKHPYCPQESNRQRVLFPSLLPAPSYPHHNQSRTYSPNLPAIRHSTSSSFRFESIYPVHDVLQVPFTSTYHVYGNPQQWTELGDI